MVFARTFNCTLVGGRSLPGLCAILLCRKGGVLVFECSSFYFFAHQFYLRWKDCLNTTSQSSAENPVLVGVLADKGLLRVAL